MDLPVGSWFAAIETRSSRRSFEPMPVGEAQLARLDLVCRGFRPYPEARAELIREPIDRACKGIIGSYGKVTGAPCYLAFIGRADSEHVQECVGYTGQGLILEAAALGLGTCWVGGLFKPGAVAPAAGLGHGERVIAVSPVGYPKTKLSFTDRTFKSLAGSKARKRLEELVGGGSIPGGALRKALEAARSAPSAVNRQPWRFRFEGRSVVVSVDKGGKEKGLSRRLDCGIAMLHFELGARAAGLAGRWELLPAPDVARFVLFES